MIHEFKGKLFLPENKNNDIKYVIQMSKTTSFNLSDFLFGEQRNYRNMDKRITLIIRYGNRTLFNQRGSVYNLSGLWFINKECVDNAIWNYVGKTVEIVINDFLQKEEVDYENNKEYIHNKVGS
jgi:hypothetical protein